MIKQKVKMKKTAYSGLNHGTKTNRGQSTTSIRKILFSKAK